MLGAAVHTSSYLPAKRDDRSGTGRLVIHGSHVLLTSVEASCIRGSDEINFMRGKGKTWTLFRGHRGGAKRRGIDFDFSYIEWIRWWRQHLGPDWLSKRGT